ncbi:hypothetical protein ACFLU3_02060 [Chloroflexota bacterium]
MEFTKLVKSVELLSPPDFKLETQEIEYRRDPLTGSTCIINKKRAERAKQTQKNAAVSNDVINETENGCFFCPGQIEGKTPKFTPDVYKGGRIRRGECVVFPNLFPFSEHHAVATFNTSHFLNLNQFSSQMIIDNILACQEWMFAVHKNNSEATYPIYMWNHMPPSGASIVHPHGQVLMRETPTAAQEHILSKSKDYFDNTGQSYWQELIRKERELGERFILENGSLAVIASYAPRGFREIQFIFKDVSNFTDLNTKQIGDFAEAIEKVLLGYKKMGVGSFNLITFSGPIGEKLDHYSLNAKIISRPFPQGVYTNDTGTFERLQDEWVIEFQPEDVAAKMQESLRK